MGRQFLRSLYRTGRRYGSRALAAYGTYAAVKRNQYRSTTRTKTKRKRSSGETAFLTYDNDFKTDYRYKRMPRRKRRAWKKFSKKVNAVINKSQGLKKHLYSYVYTNVNLINQTYPSSAMLYTPDARVADLNADMGQFFREILGATLFDTITNFGAADAQKVIRFESAQLEVTWRNTSENPVIIDLYYVRCRKDYGLTNIDVYNNPEGIFALGFDKQGLVRDVENNVQVFNAGQSASMFGTTPFQSPLFCQHYKILSKRKITIAPGNTVSKTLKDPRNRYINSGEQRARICKRNQTHGYFWQFYGVPGFDGENNPVHCLPTELVTSITKKYAYYLPVSGKDQASSGLA